MRKLDRRISDEEILFSSIGPDQLSRFDKDAAYMSFKRRIGRSAKPQSRRFVWGFAAVSICLLFLVSLLSYKAGKVSLEQKMSNILVEAPQGARLKTSLPDGTIVWLNAGSSMCYSQFFGVKDRSVRIKGEGFFDVVRNEEIPFFVISDNVKVKVIGTKFNIKDYPSDLQAFVDLQEGAVSMSCALNDEESIILEPNQRCIFDKATRNMVVKSYEVDNSIHWINGRLLFNGETLPELAKLIERCYDVSIILTDSTLSDLRFYGDFLRQDQSLVDVLDALSATGKVNYEIINSEVRIMPSNN